MNTPARLEAPPRLEVENFWPVSGPHWSNLSHEHQVRADGSKWNRITPNGSTFDEQPKSLKAGKKADMERRAALRQAVTIGAADLSDTSDAITKFHEVVGALKELQWEELALSVSGLMNQAQEGRQELVTERTDELNQMLSRECDPEALGVLLLRSYNDRLMARLGGFFVQSAEIDDGGIAQLGVSIIGTNGEAGQSPQDYEVSGLYLREA